MMRYGVDQAVTRADSDHHLSIDHEAYIIGGSHRQSVMGDFAVQQTNNKPNFRVLVIVLPSLSISIGSSVQQFAASTSSSSSRSANASIYPHLVGQTRHYVIFSLQKICTTALPVDWRNGED